MGVRVPITIALLRDLGSKVIGYCWGWRKLRLYRLSRNRSSLDFRGRSGPSITSFHYCLIPSVIVIRDPFRRRFFDCNKWSANHNMLSPFVLFEDRNFVMRPFFLELIVIASFVTANSVFSISI
jgi:hypothetical protein